MEKTIKTFNAVNGVNVEKLEIQIKASPDVFSFEGVHLVALPSSDAGSIQVIFSNDVTSDEVDAVRLIVQNHDGQPGRASDDTGYNYRRKKIRKLIDTAEYAGLPVSLTVGYRTTIDNEINGWVDSGESTILIAKIDADTANNSHPHYGFLNTVTNSQGDIVADFFKSEILG